MRLSLMFLRSVSKAQTKPKPNLAQTKPKRPVESLSTYFNHLITLLIISFLSLLLCSLIILQFYCFLITAPISGIYLLF